MEENTYYVNAMPLHDLCVAAVARMIEDGYEKHVSYIGKDDFGVEAPVNGKIPKVTIEWVDESEADSEE